MTIINAKQIKIFTIHKIFNLKMRILVLFLFEPSFRTNGNISFSWFCEVSDFARFRNFDFFTKQRLALRFNFIQKWPLWWSISFGEIRMGLSDRILVSVLSRFESRWVSWETWLCSETWLSGLFMRFVAFCWSSLRDSNFTFFFWS